MNKRRQSNCVHKTKIWPISNALHPILPPPLSISSLPAIWFSPKTDAPFFPTSSVLFTADFRDKNLAVIFLLCQLARQKPTLIDQIAKSNQAGRKEENRKPIKGSTNLLWHEKEASWSEPLINKHVGRKKKESQAPISFLAWLGGHCTYQAATLAHKSASPWNLTRLCFIILQEAGKRRRRNKDFTACISYIRLWESKTCCSFSDAWRVELLQIWISFSKPSLSQNQNMYAPLQMEITTKLFTISMFTAF